MSSRSAPIAPRRLLLSYAMGGFGLGINAMIFFLVPLRAAELGLGMGTIGLLLGTKSAMDALASVPVGSLLDRHGAKRVFTWGTALTSVFAVLLAVAESPYQLFALQALLGLVRPAGWVGAQTYVAGLRSGAEKAHDTGRMSFVATTSQIVAPALVGVTAQIWNVRTGFLTMALYAAAFAVIGTTLPRDERRSSERAGSAGFRESARLLAIRGIRTVMLLTFARLFVSGVWTGFFPLVLVSSGVSEGGAGAVVSAMGLVGSAISLAAGRLSRLGRLEYVTAIGLGASAVGLGISPLVAGLPQAFIPAALIGIGQGISLPLLIALVSRAAPPDQRGLALGLRSAVNQVAASLAPILTGSAIGAVGVALGFPLAALVVGASLVGAAASAHRDPLLE